MLLQMPEADKEIPAEGQDVVFISSEMAGSELLLDCVVGTPIFYSFQGGE